MEHYIKTLQENAKQAAFRDEAEREERANAKMATARDRLALLEDRLKRLLGTIPTPVQAEGLSLMALQTHFRGRGQGHMHCHVGELGTALRRLGFIRKRSWQEDADGFRALWYPRQQQ
jgi:hypothetical protein